MNKNALEIENLTVHYNSTAALWDVSLSVPQGAMVAIVGPNGAGKSTLIKTALGLIKPLFGKTTLLEQPLKKVRSQIAYVPQRESVDWDFPITVFDLVLMGRYGKAKWFKRLSKEDKACAWHYLQELGLESVAHRQINELSGGQKQRAFIARSLCQQASLYFMDEPLIGIDVPSTNVIVNAMKKMKNEGKTLFVVHHDLTSVPEHFDWVILLNMRLVACGKVQEVFTPELILQTYGKDHGLLAEAMKLSKEKGLRCPA